MSTDTELEQVLRNTLQSRAATVSTGPRWQAPAETPARPPRPRWIAPLAAAAAVIAIVAGVFTVVPHLTGGPNHATHSTNPPSPSPSPTPTPTPSPTGRPTCVAALPSAWRTAVGDAAVSLGSPNAQPLSVAADGTIVALADAGPLPGTSRTVMLIPPHGAPTAAYTVADPDTYSVQSAQLYQHWLVIAVTRDPRPPAHTIPGSSPMPNVHELVVVDRRTGRHADVPIGSRYTDFATAFDGRVYWSSKSSYGASTTTIRSYGLTAHDVRVEYAGPAQYWVATAGGIGNFQSQHAVVTATLPAAIRAAVGTDTLSVATDGTAWAWLQHKRTELGWWTPGQSRPTVLKLPHAVAANEADSLAVSGRFVFGYGLPLVDVRTAAVASATFAGTTSLGLAGGPIISGTSYQRDGTYVQGYWRDGTSQVLRLSSAGLPDLHC